MRPVRIGIDARLYFQTGVGTYLRNFLRYLPDYRPKGTQFVVYVMDGDLPRVDWNMEGATIQSVPYRWHSFGEQFGFHDRLVEDNLDLMHFTYFSYPVRYQKPFIATVHDLTPMLMKTGRASTRNPIVYEMKYRAFEFVMASQISNAARILTPTRTIRDQIVSRYGEHTRDRISAIYEGVDHELISAIPDPSVLEGLTGNWHLYVGNFYPHKNVERLIRAVAETSDTSIVLCGPDDHFAGGIRNLVHAHALDNRVHFRLNASTAQLSALYQHACALVHPSLSEGFGLTLVEAMHFGLPVIASDIPVFRELLGDRYTRFDPLDIASIREAFHVPRKVMKQEYAELLKSYSFARMTRDIVNIYRDTLAGKL
jgi:glycosyltransferase involved in cell wall biosynthesis